MLRLYSTFAAGWPGIGLIIMRLAVGAAVLYNAGSVLRESPSFALALSTFCLAGAAILVVIGLYTTIAGALVAVMEIWSGVTRPADWLLYGLVATLGAALAMLGPGLWSVDARLFGWKRIEPSPRKS